MSALFTVIVNNIRELRLFESVAVTVSKYVPALAVLVTVRIAVFAVLVSQFNPVIEPFAKVIDLLPEPAVTVKVSTVLTP